MNQAVKIDREGLQDIRTGERHTMILAEELEVRVVHSNIRLTYFYWDLYMALISWYCSVFVLY